MSFQGGPQEGTASFLRASRPQEAPGPGYPVSERRCRSSLLEDLSPDLSGGANSFSLQDRGPWLAWACRDVFERVLWLCSEVVLTLKFWKRSARPHTCVRVCVCAFVYVCVASPPHKAEFSGSLVVCVCVCSESSQGGVLWLCVCV